MDEVTVGAAVSRDPLLYRFLETVTLKLYFDNTEALFSSVLETLYLVFEDVFIVLISVLVHPSVLGNNAFYHNHNNFLEGDLESILSGHLFAEAPPLRSESPFNCSVLSKTICHAKFLHQLKYVAVAIELRHTTRLQYVAEIAISGSLHTVDVLDNRNHKLGRDPARSGNVQVTFHQDA
ncbi:hypothetical protein HDU97_006779 [Phlyctochytrium planicorne]|nr:hypothetical protein HDU97_006779 [Phlyctochytrium planicorne]